SDVLRLLRLAHELGIHVRGLSFHVGSQCASPRAHVLAIDACRELIAAAREANLPALRGLDIGGGCPGSYLTEALDIDAFCGPIRRALAGVPPTVRVISEPGRYIVAPAAHSVASIVGKARRGESLWYYLDDGVYGSYSGQVYDGARYPLTVVGEKSGVPR